MISRRLLRIKVLQLLYAYYKNHDRSLVAVEKELFLSIQKAYDLYHSMLLLIVEIAYLAEKKIDAAKNRLIPSYEDTKPNTRFIDNSVIKQLAQNNQLISYSRSNLINWANNAEFLKQIYNTLKNSEVYKNYMEQEQNNYQEDKKLIIKFFSNLVVNNDALFSLLEENSIYWNDDIDFILQMVIKTLKKIKETDDKHTALLPLFNSNEDKDFPKKLFRKCLHRHKEHLEIIKLHTKNWEIDRIAFMDLLIMEMALTEIVEFESIPVKVSFNEYLEIAKYYSTSNSSNFINGILDKMVKTLRKEEKIKKTGRGLQGEV